jgi:LAO/AO transport system kinase
MDDLVNRVRNGDRRSLARAMSIVDRSGDEAQALKDKLRRKQVQASWWGLTGPPGVGKSTLIDALLSRLRSRGDRVGVVAVDPTSPCSGGALLGDRVRMMRHAVDHDVFIRSLATHNREGGLSEATLHCARLLDLAGYDPVLIETVGVGQNEVDISVADICVVVLGPGFGDDIQLVKAGLLEVADMIVVNKCDLPGADRLLEGVRVEMSQASLARSRGTTRLRPAMPEGRPDGHPVSIDVLGVEAKSGVGVDSLIARILELDAASRSEENRTRQRHKRLLGELRHGALVLYEQALDRALHASAAEELLAQFDRGDVSLDDVALRIATEVLADAKNANVRQCKSQDAETSKRRTSKTPKSGNAKRRR